MNNALQDIDFFAPDTMSNPHEAFSLARAQAPVYRVPDQDIVMVFSYDHVKEALMQPEIFSSKNEEALLGPSIHSARCQEIYKKGWMQVPTLLTNDPPAHTRFRRLVNRAFTAPRVDEMEEHIIATVDDVLDTFIRDGQCEFVSQFAVPLPCQIIAGQIGIDRKDIGQLKQWSDAFIELIGSELNEEEQIVRAEQVVEFQHYVKANLDSRREAPQDDMLTVLLNARVDDERPLDDAELLSVAQQLLVAGNATTTHMLAGGLWTLLQNPEQMAKVRADHSLIPGMVEELVRLQSPTKGMWRRATKDTELNGVAIPKGTRMLLMYSSANRDEKYFDNPHAMDVERKFDVPHLAFSRGIHTCIGMMLSRKEQVCAFRRIFERMDDIALQEGVAQPDYVPSMLFRGIEKLPITFRAR